MNGDVYARLDAEVFEFTAGRLEVVCLCRGGARMI